MASNTDDYLSSLPGAQRAALQSLRHTIAVCAPEATETISTNVPAFHYKGKYLVSFSATKSHLALLVMRGVAIKTFAKELAEYDTGSRIIRFTTDKPLPKELIEQIVKFRVEEIDAK